VNSLPKTVIRQRRGCDSNPGPSAPESSTLTTRLPSHLPYEGTRKVGAYEIRAVSVTGHGRLSQAEIANRHAVQVMYDSGGCFTANKCT